MKDEDWRDFDKAIWDAPIRPRTRGERVLDVLKTAVLVALTAAVTFIVVRWILQ